LPPWRGLTPEEEALLEQTAALWNAFLALPRGHPDEQTEFRHQLHDLQRMIIARPYFRSRPGQLS
jgi:hypothetical protein